MNWWRNDFVNRMTVKVVLMLVTADVLFFVAMLFGLSAERERRSGGDVGHTGRNAEHGLSGSAGVSDTRRRPDQHRGIARSWLTAKIISVRRVRQTTIAQLDSGWYSLRCAARDIFTIGQVAVAPPEAGQGCCKMYIKGKACGNSCISAKAARQGTPPKLGPGRWCDPLSGGGSYPRKHPPGSGYCRVSRDCAPRGKSPPDLPGARDLATPTRAAPTFAPILISFSLGWSANATANIWPYADLVSVKLNRRFGVFCKGSNRSVLYGQSMDRNGAEARRRMFSTM